MALLPRWARATDVQAANGYALTELRVGAVNLPRWVRFPALFSLYACGDNSDCAIGDNTGTERDTPVAVALASGVTPTAIAAGSRFMLAIGGDRVPYAWGWNQYGTLGDGTTTQRNIPTPITLASGVSATAVAAGYFHSLAIGSDGRVYAWGRNNYGQIGDATYTQRTSPVPITLAAGVTARAIAAGYTHSLALGSDGNVYGWGGNGGALGRGTTTSAEPSPLGVTLASGVRATAIAAGTGHSMAIGSDGRIYGYGGGSYGRLGDGSLADFSVPNPIWLPGGVPAVAISAGEYFTLAIAQDGTLYAFGRNQYGALGDGTTTQRNTPVPVTLATGITAAAISAGRFHGLAVGSDGLVYSWGMNGTGQLGDGSTTDRATPAPCTLPPSTAMVVAAGGSFSGTLLLP